jgi:hypothetical protein
VQIDYFIFLAAPLLKESSVYFDVGCGSGQQGSALLPGHCHFSWDFFAELFELNFGSRYACGTHFLFGLFSSAPGVNAMDGYLHHNIRQ